MLLLCMVVLFRLLCLPESFQPSIVLGCRVHLMPRPLISVPLLDWHIAFCSTLIIFPSLVW